MREALGEAILAANPRTIVKNKVRISKSYLTIQTEDAPLTFDLRKVGRIFVIGGGKASASMAEELEKILGNRITAGALNVPNYLKARPRLKKITLNGASHPVPDQSGVSGVERMLKLTESLNQDDLVICLISGGGSSLLPLPAGGITLRDKQKVTSLLLKSGADIHEINTVRKHISGVKGGRLAQKLQPATIISLIISDVVGDELDSIASGPTYPDSTTFKEAREILQRRGIWNEVPFRVRKLIEGGVSGRIKETPKSDSKKIFERCYNVVIGSNKMSCVAAAKKMKKAGYRTMILTTKIQGEARQVGGILSSIASDISKNHFPLEPPAAVIAGGETTVVIHGNGIGGRNQEVALSASLGIRGLGAVIASIGTDGVDGPTKAAGAIVDGKTVERAIKRRLDVKRYLDNNDSNNFFKKLGDLVTTGPTGTNVNDIMIAAVES